MVRGDGDCDFFCGQRAWSEVARVSHFCGRDEMADMPVLEAGGVTRESSSLSVRTIMI